jgi:anti-sigma-K factor RskA
MSHDDASELLGAYALDAVDGEELTELEAHLSACPRCRSELDSFREVAAGIGNSVEPVPEGLWSTIASRLPEHQGEEDEAPPMPRLVGESRAPFRPPPDARRRRPSRITVATLGAIAVAAAAVAVVLGIGLVRADNRVSGLQSAAAHPRSVVVAALHARGHKVVDLTTTTHAQIAQFVVLTDGRGYMVSSTLPRLPGTETYQLWGIVGTKPVSLGVLGDDPQQAAFTMAGSTRPSRLSITAEPSGGSVAPTGPILATGTV